MKHNIQKTQNRERLALASFAGLGALTATNTNALSPADITTATTANDASSSIDAGALWVLGIVVGIFAVRKVIGMFGR